MIDQVGQAKILEYPGRDIDGALTVLPDAGLRAGAGQQDADAQARSAHERY